MSWLFRSKKEPQNFTEFVPPGGLDDVGSGNDKPPNKEMEAYRFDSAALERAAAAAKELEKSKFAKEAFELAKMQIKERESEMETKRKQFEVHLKQLSIEEKAKDFEDKKQLLQDKSKLDQQNAQYQDQLSRKRYEDQLRLQQKLNEDNIKKQDDAIARQESMKRETLLMELEKTAEKDIKMFNAKYAAKGKYEKDTKDIAIEKMREEHLMDRETQLEKIREFRKTKMDTLKTLSGSIGYAMDQVISSTDKIKNIVLATIAIGAGIYTAKRGSKTAFNYLETKLLQPQLVTNTSRITPIDFLKRPIHTLKKLRRKSGDVLEGIILHPKVEAKIRDIALSTKNTKKHNEYFSNITLYGPPGTGKTMFAQKLASISGMDYAIIAGGDLAIPGKDAVYQLNKLFDWAESSRKGMVLFIDEADSFMFKRSDVASGEEHNKILSIFLHRTGQLSKKFTVVTATNRPEQFDHAVSNRMSKFVVFPLPTLNERVRLIRKYFNDFVVVPSTSRNSRLKIGKFDYSKACLKVAEITDGFSGREIAHLAIEWRSTAFASEDGMFTEEIMISLAKEAVEEYKMKKAWYSDKEKSLEKFSIALMKMATAENNKKSENKDHKKPDVETDVD